MYFLFKQKSAENLLSLKYLLVKFDLCFMAPSIILSIVAAKTIYFKATNFLNVKDCKWK